MLDVPAVRREAGALVLGRERHRGRAVDRDVVVVVHVDERAEPKVSRDRGRLRGDALHQVAVGADGIDPVTDDLVVRTVVPLGEETLGDRHPDAVAESLPERARRRLDTRRVAVLGMTRRPRAPLPELLQVSEREVVPREVKSGVLKDARVPGRQHEAVTVGPRRVGRVVAHELAVQEVREWRERHRGAGMPGVGLLHGVHCQDPDGVDRQTAGIGGCVAHRTETICARGTLTRTLRLPELPDRPEHLGSAPKPAAAPGT